MKKIFLLLILGILFVGYVSACQYTINNKFDKEIVAFSEDNVELPYPALEAKDFIDGYTTMYCYYPNFKVYNNYNQEINVTVSYIFQGQKISEEKIIASKGYALVQNNACGQSGLDTSSVSYIINTPTNLKYGIILKKFDNVVCKICPNGKQCLDDGTICSEVSENSLECGSKICNIAGFCGQIKIVPCEPYSKLNCNNESCLTPSKKEVGESYMCSWECKSDRYGEGKCLKSSEQLKIEKGARIRNWVYWILGVSILTILIVIVVKYFIKKGPLVRKIRELEIKIAGLDVQFKQKETEIQDLEKRGADLVDIIRENENLIQIRKNEINSISEMIILKEEELKNVKGKIKRKTEEELRELIVKREKVTKENNLLKQANDKREEELKRKDKLAIKENARYWNLEEDNLEINKKGYIQFKKDAKIDKPGMELHRYIYFYKMKFTKGENTHIHHIDGNKLNNREWNLIALKESEHEKIKNMEIKNERWSFGIDELKKRIHGIEFHKYIKEHLESEKNNKVSKT